MCKRIYTLGMCTHIQSHFKSHSQRLVHIYSTQSTPVTGHTNSMFVGSTAGSSSRIADPLHHLHKKKERSLHTSYNQHSTEKGFWSQWHLTSLVARLPHSRTRTSKLCRCGEPGIFLSREHHQRQKGGRKTLIVGGRAQRLRTGKGAKGFGGEGKCFHSSLAVSSICAI